MYNLGTHRINQEEQEKQMCYLPVKKQSLIRYAFSNNY